MNSAKVNQSIGVFDSGMGGLTVLRSLKSLLPNESFIYLGDTARLPYGTKSKETVVHYAENMIKILLMHEVKLVVIACNTASASALPYLRKKYPQVGIIGVIEPGARQAVNNCKNNQYLLLATETTIKSGIYHSTINQLDQNSVIKDQSCGLFVALAEEGIVSGEIADLVVKEYLTPVIKDLQPGSSVILGCTHFPALREPIKKLLGDKVSIIDSASATAVFVYDWLADNGLLNTSYSEQTCQFFVTDLPERFTRVGKVFFDKPIDAIQIEHTEYTKS